MTNANETPATLFPAASAYLARFNREVVVNLNAADVRDITGANLDEQKMNIADALHRANLFGPSTFVIFRISDFNGFEVCGAMPSAEVDAAAWAEVERFVLAAKHASAYDLTH